MITNDINYPLAHFTEATVSVLILYRFTSICLLFETRPQFSLDIVYLSWTPVVHFSDDFGYSQSSRVKKKKKKYILGGHLFSKIFISISV